VPCNAPFADPSVSDFCYSIFDIVWRKLHFVSYFGPPWRDMTVKSCGVCTQGLGQGFRASDFRFIRVGRCLTFCSSPLHPTNNIPILALDPLPGGACPFQKIPLFSAAGTENVEAPTHRFYTVGSFSQTELLFLLSGFDRKKIVLHLKISVIEITN
jgi:hypothetical protein